MVAGLAASLLGAKAALAVPPMGDVSRAPRCEIDERLDVMALVYNDTRPEKSYAMIAAGRGGGRMIGVGSYVDGRPVLAILPGALWLGPEEDMCWMPLSHQGSQRVDSPRARGKPKPKPKKPKSKRGGRR